LKKRTIFIVALVLSAASIGYGRSKRVDQIPNGSKFSCLNCHNGQGGPRNPFGSMVESGHLTVPGVNGDVVWGLALYTLDADGDGFTNGAELQDAEGSWRTGNANPGTYSFVTNPGDPKSVPASAVDLESSAPVPRRMELDPNYPNPFNAATRIRIRMPYPDILRLRVFDLNGAVVWEERRTVNPAGDIELTWNGSDLSLKPLGSGVYLLIVESSLEFRSMRMLLIK